MDNYCRVTFRLENLTHACHDVMFSEELLPLKHNINIMHKNPITHKAKDRNIENLVYVAYMLKQRGIFS